eukprot:Lithocolla_globosa_v1_NODE_494_length_3896_cov_10.491931.p2 type:complete len:175 gc:universal NODE_494_length_3896_cov_10.491931:2352-2876(+)
MVSPLNRVPTCLALPCSHILLTQTTASAAWRQVTHLFCTIGSMMAVSPPTTTTLILAAVVVVVVVAVVVGMTVEVGVRGVGVRGVGVGAGAEVEVEMAHRMWGRMVFGLLGVTALTRVVFLAVPDASIACCTFPTFDLRCLVSCSASFILPQWNFTWTRLVNFSKPQKFIRLTT